MNLLTPNEIYNKFVKSNINKKLHFFEDGNIYYKEARIVMICNKIYCQDLTIDNFLDNSISKNYPKKDYHRMYIGEIYKILIK